MTSTTLLFTVSASHKFNNDKKMTRSFIKLD